MTYLSVKPPAPRRFEFVGARGGQGTTIVALVAAAVASRYASTLLLTTRPEDVCAAAGLPDPPDPETPVTLGRNLALGTVSRPMPGERSAAVVVADLGRLSDRSDEPSLGDGEVTRWLVVRGPCYLSLRAAVEHPAAFDGVVLVTERKRAISAADVADVLETRVVAQVPVDPDVARAIDAGLLLAPLRRLVALSGVTRLVREQLGAVEAD